MKLAGQGASRPSATRRGFDERGYIMVALLVGMAVVAVWMTALLPSWRQQIVREREAELVFRGEQYARAIVLYRAKNNNQLPPNIDVLVSGHYLRKKYLDPIAGKDFIPVGGMTTGINPGGGTGGPTGPTGGGNSGPPRGGGIGNQPGGPAQGAGQPQGQVGITGVRSTSTAGSIRIYKNQQTYSQWPFDWNQMALQMGRQNPTGPGGRPGGPGGLNNGPGGRPGGAGNAPGGGPVGGPLGAPGGRPGGAGPGGGPIRNPPGGGGPLGPPIGPGRGGGSTPN